MMTVPEMIGSAGVALLLLAFVLNLLGVLARSSPTYHALNAVGAGVAGYASYLIGFLPFVVLEATWCLAAVVALLGAVARRP